MIRVKNSDQLGDKWSDVISKVVTTGRQVVTFTL